MAWIRVDQSLRDHRKLVALASQLDVSLATATGHLVLLWLWCLDNAPTGLCKAINGQQIATACAWAGNANDLVNALISSGFMDKCGRGGATLRIHDWYEYAGRLMETRAANKERMRRARAANVQDTYGERAGATERNETKRNVTKDNDPTPLKPPQGGAGRRRRRSDDGQPLSGKYRERVQH